MPTPLMMSVNDRDHDVGVESTEQHSKAARTDRDAPAGRDRRVVSGEACIRLPAW